MKSFGDPNKSPHPVVNIPQLHDLHACMCTVETKRSVGAPARVPGSDEKGDRAYRVKG